MRKTKMILTLVLCLLLTLALFGCNTPEPSVTEPTPPPTSVTPTEPPLSDQYIQAAEPLRNAKNLVVELTSKKTITTEAGVFNWVSEQDLTLTNIGTDTFSASLTENLELDGLSDEYTEYYANEKLYVNVADSGYFLGSITEADFLARFAPGVLIDETLYASITEEKTDAGITLTFSDPAGAETWALPEGAEFLNAYGVAKITSNGTLSRTIYTIEYTQGTSTITEEITAEAEIYDGAPLELPSDLSVYQEIENIEAIWLYEAVVLYLCSAETISFDYNEICVSQAAGCALAYTINSHLTGYGNDHLSELEYTVNYTDSSLYSETYTQTERLENGVYTLTSPDAEPQTDTSITDQAMRDYIFSYYTDDLPSLSYITSVTAEEIGGLIYIEMELNEAWGQETADYISLLLYDDADFLNSHASAYQTTNSTYYLAVDPATGFPISSGATFSGYHTIEGEDYTLSWDLTKTYQIASSETYEMLAGDAFVETPPEEQATPLFYHVTGTNGQEMYLLGTIHAGDARTAYLPSEIYDALDLADALAVEFDILADEDALENDAEYAAQQADYYMNPDNTATKDILEPEVYEKAVKLLKLSGNYNASMEYVKPNVWSSVIDNFFLSLSPLRSEKGVDRRLLKLAKESEKEILDIESALSQLEMLTGFSQELQISLLEGSLEYTAAEYNEELQTLFDLWCAGDEAALREYLTDDTSDLTEEEMVLYQEYTDAMLIDRNEAMLDVAISYLESGDTVFYAVGLAHLLQENGLVDTLQEAGYTVEQVTYN